MTTVDTVDLVQLKSWSERLCRLAATDPWHVVGTLGLGVAPATHIRGVGRVGRAPSGVTVELGMMRGGFRSMKVTFAVPAIPRSAFEDAMGPGVPLRRVGPAVTRQAVEQVAYRVVIPGAPFSVDVVAGFAGFAGFAERSRPHVPATYVVLRRHRGVTRSPGERLDDEGWAAASGDA